MKEEEMELSVSSCGSAADRWKDRTKRPIITKIVKRDIGDFALILAEDASKPLRYLYLKLLLGKNAVENLKKILNRVQVVALRYSEIPFEGMTVEMKKKVGRDPKKITKELNVLRKKMEAYGADHIAIVKLCMEYDIVDPVLVLALRAVASSRELKIENAFNCASAFSLKQIETILALFSSEVLPTSSCMNRFICFEDLTEIDCQYFR